MSYVNKTSYANNMSYVNNISYVSYVDSVSYMSQVCRLHCVKSVRIWNYSSPYYPEFGLNMERYSISRCIELECRKIRTRITPYMDTFHTG